MSKVEEFLILTKKYSAIEFPVEPAWPSEKCVMTEEDEPKTKCVHVCVCVCVVVGSLVS